MSFVSLGLRAELLRGIEELGFTEPTAIQKDTVPVGISGRDVLACSMTGSGKTAAFGLPILHRLMDCNRGVTRALILTPTRELAAQIEDHLAALAKHTDIRIASVYGGVSMGPQKRAFKDGVDIIVATPGRLLDHLQFDYAQLFGLQTLVLDEADRMLDMGFLPDIRRILKQVPVKRQTLFFSATMPPQIAQLSNEMLKDPFKLNLERRAAPATGVKQSVYPVPHHLKSELLTKLIKGTEVKNMLVFVRTKRRADRLAKLLNRDNLKCGCIHGDRTQAQRTHALESFRHGRFQILVATDVAARGIDIEALSHVVNYDVPGQPEDYIHRVGRTARAALTGDAFTFVSPDEEGSLRDIEKAIHGKLPRTVLPDFDYKKPLPEKYAQQQQHGREGRRGHSHSKNAYSHERREGGNGRHERREDRHARTEHRSERTAHSAHSSHKQPDRKQRYEGNVLVDAPRTEVDGNSWNYEAKKPQRPTRPWERAGTGGGAANGQRNFWAKRKNKNRAHFSARAGS